METRQNYLELGLELKIKKIMTKIYDAVEGSAIQYSRSGLAEINAKYRKCYFTRPSLKTMTSNICDYLKCKVKIKKRGHNR